MSRSPAASAYVTRGGLKLEHALQFFKLNPAEKTVIDVGCAHGGFTDCLLQHGARKIYCVDVGYGQLDWKLRNDPRVVVLERQNIRYLSTEKIPEKVDWAVMDVAFISLKKVFPVVEKFLVPNAQVLALVKPQFEVRKKEVGPKGVVKDPELHERVVEEIRAAGEKLDWKFQGSTPSPILGAEGNREFFLLFQVLALSPQNDIFSRSK